LEKKIKDAWGKASTREYTFNEFQRIKFFFEKVKGDNCIDNITWNDLGMDDVFKDMNNTSSSVGEECFYRMLRDTSFDVDILKKRDVIVDYLLEHEEEAMKLEKIFALMGRSKSISVYEFIHRLDHIEKTDNIQHYFCDAFLVVAISSFFIKPEVGIVLAIAAVVFSVVTYFSSKAKVENYFVCFKYIIAMLDGAKKVSDLNISALDEYNLKLDKLYTGLKKHFRGSGLFTNGNVGGSLTEIILDYVRMITHIDLIMFNSMVANLKKHRKEADELYECLGETEAFYAIASYRKFLRNGYGYYCKPEFSETRKICAHSVYHPMIEKPVANSIETEKGVLLTGSNASGKSTFLKTIAINGILAQSVYTCTAESFTMKNAIVMSSMALKDDLENNESYYIVEIKSLKRILDKMKAGSSIMCFVDEVLRGTNTVERIAASSEILQSLENENVMCFAATHDIELTHILENSFNNYHFREEIKDNDILFDYKLFEGRAVTRNAIKLLNIIGYDRDIIERAEGRALKFTDIGKWE